MVLLYKELIQKYESDYKIKKLIQEGKIFKIEKGIYSDKKNVNYLEIISIVTFLILHVLVLQVMLLLGLLV